MREVGIIVTNQGNSLLTVFGDAISVEFPAEEMWEIHRRFPGLIKVLAHTHPSGLKEMSEIDRTTLLAWTHAFSPSPIFMEVVCKTGNEVSRMRYRYEIESLESWRKQGKPKEGRKAILHKMDISDGYEHWVKQIIYLSYRLEEAK